MHALLNLIGIFFIMLLVFFILGCICEFIAAIFKLGDHKDE